MKKQTTFEELMLPEHSHRVRNALAALAACVMSACTDPSSPSATILVEDGYGAKVEWAGDPALARALAALRDTTDEFHDVNVALARGYRPSAAGCESHGDEGAMGIHYGHAALLGVVRGSNPTRGTDPVIDPLKPEVIIYEPQPDGSRRLVAVEFVVYRAAWDSVNSQPPTFAGVPFDLLEGAAAHGHADHYELHVWLWRHNPSGMFAPWNPKVSCSL